MFFPLPSGPELTATQRGILDDRFLSSDPFGYFSARIDMLLQWQELNARETQDFATPMSDADSGSKTDEGTARARFSRYIGLNNTFPPRQVKRSATTQLATDTYALRHHAAESLVRMAACLMEEPDRCIWEALSTGQTQMNQVIDQLHGSFQNEDAAVKFTRLIVRRDDLENPKSDDLASAVSVFADWLQFAVDLLSGHALDLNAAHNKIKHGLAVRGRDDLRITFTTGPVNSDETVPLSSLTGPEAIDIFDRPVLEVLARAPKQDGHKQGLELTQLRVDVSAMLAEAYMIAWTLGAIFGVRAESHFRGRSVSSREFEAPVHPGYPVRGPGTKHIAPEAPVGMRFPLTNPPGGGQMARSMGLGFRDTFTPLIRGSGPDGQRGRVIADEFEGL